MTGETISHYRILEKLGEGGMGVVYRAEDRKLHRTVALKFLPPHLSHHGERFLREARAAASLNHPNICTIFEVDEQHGFIAMELIEALNLRQKIDARPLPLPEALDIAIQTCAGLQTAHDKGVIHRDIKPANLMITSQGLVKVMDFGLALTNASSRITEKGAFLGTPAYISPEQLQCLAVDRRTDIWSLGVVLYEMLAGRVPFAGDSAQATSFGIIHSEPEPLTALRSQLPKDLDRVVAKALRKDRDERYANAEDLAVDLRAILAGAPLSKSSRRTHLYATAAALTAAMGGAAWFFAAGRPAFLSRSPRIDAIAVLPLENLSGNSDQEYFADGMTEELTGEIARISSLRVISRTSVMQYKKTQKSLPAIAHELSVQAVVTGTVVQSAGKVRITAQLIRADNEQHLWSEKYERNLADVIALQGEVARSIADRIHLKLTPQQQTNLTRTRQVHPEAYETFLRGNHFLHRGIPGTAKSIELFTDAIKLDPGFAEAYAGLAQALVYAGIFGFRPSFQANPEARAAAFKALELDPSSAAAHNVLADVKKGYDWDLAAAEVEYQRALQLNPSHLLTHLWYADCFSRMRRYDEAIAESQRSLELDPNFLNALWWQGLAYAAKNDFTSGIRLLTAAAEKSPAPLFRAHLAYILARAGQRAKATETLNQFLALSKQRYVNPADISVIYLGLGDAESVFFWLDKAYQSRDAAAHMLMLPHYDVLRSDPRFAVYSQRVGLPL